MGEGEVPWDVLAHIAEGEQAMAAGVPMTTVGQLAGEGAEVTQP